MMIYVYILIIFTNRVVIRLEQKRFVGEKLFVSALFFKSSNFGEASILALPPKNKRFFLKLELFLHGRVFTRLTVEKNQRFIKGVL